MNFFKRLYKYLFNIIEIGDIIVIKREYNNCTYTGYYMIKGRHDSPNNQSLFQLGYIGGSDKNLPNINSCFLSQISDRPFTKKAVINKDRYTILNWEDI